MSLRLLLPLLACALPMAAAQPRAPSERVEPTVTVEVELVKKSANPTPEQLVVYQEGLTTYEYKVVKAAAGTVDGQRIAVAHWAVKRNITQSVTKAQPGAKATLQLRPWKEVVAISKYYDELPNGCDVDLDLPMYFDAGQQLQLPGEEKGRWNYGIEIGQKMPTFFLLKDQLKLVVLGDCAAAHANRCEQYMAEENAKTPVSYSMAQERACLGFYKLLTDEYLSLCPKLEWVVLTWNPRYVSSGWTVHGMKLKGFLASTGYRYDQAHRSELAAPGPATVTIEQILGMPQHAKAWQERPWGWRPSPEKTWTSPQGQEKEGLRKLGTYAVSEERWALFASILETLERRKVKLLVFTQPNHPLTIASKVKDKDGSTEPDILAQNERMRALAERHPRTLFFLDLNQMGKNGLPTEGFGDIDHLNPIGAKICSERIEAFRKECLAKAATTK